MKRARVAPEAKAGRRRLSASKPASARRRGQQRWHALLHQRVARLMRPRLGDAAWAAFVTEATAAFYGDFVDALSGVVRCAGPLDGGACPRGVVVDCASEAERLPGLHWDHELRRCAPVAGCCCLPATCVQRRCAPVAGCICLPATCVQYGYR